MGTFIYVLLNKCLFILCAYFGKKTVQWVLLWKYNICVLISFFLKLLDAGQPYTYILPIGCGCGGLKYK